MNATSDSTGAASPGAPIAVPLQRSPFVSHLGCELGSASQGRAELSLAVQEGMHTNLFGVAHGGVLMTMLDVVMAYAARSTAASVDESGLVTLEMKSSFLRPGQGHLRAEGSVLHRTPSLAFCEGRVLDEQGRICAHATGTFKFMRALPVSATEVRSAGCD